MSTAHDDIPWIGVRFLDKTGKVFERDGYYYRAVYPAAEAHAVKVLRSPSFRNAVDRGLHVPVEISSLRLDGYSLVLKSPACPWSFPADVWVTKSLKAAALTWIDLNLLLLDHDLQLADAHYNNYAFDAACRPTWVDFGSIQPLNSSLTGLDEFVRLHCLPLLTILSEPSISSIIRPSLLKGGINFKQAKAMQMANWRIYALRRVSRWSGKLKLDGKKAQFVLRVIRKILNQQQLRLEPGFWSAYHAERPLEKANDFAARDIRSQKIREIVIRLKPTSILDVGANTGYHLASLSSYCDKLLAVEKDEVAVSKFVEWSNQTLGTSSSRCAAAGIIGDLQTARVQADLVLALALTHHVSLTEKFNFVYIARRLAELSKSSVITEFMPNGLGVLEKQEDLPIWYNLESFLNALRLHWSDVSVESYDMPAGRSPRTLVVATNKKK